MSSPWFVLGIVAVSTTIAVANPQKDAEALAAKGKFAAAAAKFREAYAAERKPELICNVGVAYFKAKDLPRAHRYLRSCLALGKDLDRGFMDSVAKVLSAVDAQLTAGAFTPVELIVQPPNAKVSVEGNLPFDEPLADGARVWFPNGEYRLVISADGYVTQQQQLRATTKSADVQRYVLERVTAPKPATPPPVVATAPIPTTQPATPPQPETPGPTRPSITAPVAASGATVISGILTLVFHLKTRDYATQAGETSDADEYQRLVGLADSAQTKTWVFGALTGVGAVASGYLWYRWHRASKLTLDVSSHAGGASVTLGGTW